MNKGFGRFAPSPSSDLHLGNLRTAVVAYLAAKTTDRGFLLRLEDLDERSRPQYAKSQLQDLAALGLRWSEPVVAQSGRQLAYRAALERLVSQGLVYECFCNRRDILQAPQAPHAPPGAYPGTCRGLSETERQERHSLRPGAWRLRSAVPQLTVEDQLFGSYTGQVDDFVLMRADGRAAYNLAVVVDDAASRVTQLVRGQDLLASTPRQAHLADLLGYARPEYLHVPLVVNQRGQRLSKRDHALAGTELWQTWGGAAGLVNGIGQSLGLLKPGETGDLHKLATRFDVMRLPKEPWVV